MRFFGRKYRSILALCLVAICVCGCADNPARSLWYRQQWEEDEKHGPTFHTRLEDLTSLRTGADQLNEAEQARVAQQLNQVLAEDPSPLYRGEAVRTLGSLSTPIAAEGLGRAIQDNEPSVRIAACQAWADRGDQEALQVLSQVVGSDTDLDVRMAATRGLANFSDPAAVRALGLALDDADPALQHRAVQSLRAVTGEDFGNSVPAWRQFVRGEPVRRPDPPSIAESLRNLF
ncbi:MAG: HEAT repeat domain-containing protein [Planctomycetes bacterium]|nr:HEAT repeat domain-containing protein [Planctomycetota bacterium]MBL7042338.1 HEAT repeat domain-containing protein [Pirellulaceae bacterium]